MTCLPIGENSSLSLPISSKVLEFLQPEELKKKFQLQLAEEPTSNEELESLAENVIKYSLKTGEVY